MQNKQIIPDGWKIQKLGDLATVERGKFSVRPRNDPAYYGGNMPFVQTGDVSNSRVYLNNYSQSLNDEGILVSKVFQPDTILITIAANIGDTAITKFPVACPDSIVAIYGKDVSIYWLNSALRVKKGELESCATQNAQKNINLEILKPLKILTPPLEEQEKIAQILATWDSAIEQLTDLIAEKQHQKKALMQRLLTGKQRLPGFNKPWKNVRLGDIGKITSGKSKSSVLVDDGLFTVVDMGAVSISGRLLEHKKTNLAEDFLQTDDLIMPKDDIGGGNIIGKSILITENNKYVLGDHVFRLVVAEYPRFISYKINSFYVNKYMRRVCTGSAQLGLAKRDVEKCNLYIPADINEQKAIADVLMAADAEIDLLQQQLQVITEQKQGLMQQLLTGNIRVKIDKKS